MKCKKCGAKMIADREHKYGAKIGNSTLYVCTGSGCGLIRRVELTSRKVHTKPLSNQPVLLKEEKL